MTLNLPDFPLARTLTADGRLLFATRCARLFAYGLLSVVLALYLKAVGLSEGEIGLLLTLTLLGDTAISLGLTTTADRLGRRKMLVAGSLLMIFAGVVFALTSNFWLLLLAATVGVISPTGNEVGPFLSIEQAALSQTVPGEQDPSRCRLPVPSTRVRSRLSAQRSKEQRARLVPVAANGTFGDAQGLACGQDGDLRHRIGVRAQCGDESVACLVNSDGVLLLREQNVGVSPSAQQDPVSCPLEVLSVNDLAAEKFLRRGQHTAISEKPLADGKVAHLHIDQHDPDERAVDEKA